MPVDWGPEHQGGTVLSRQPALQMRSPEGSQRGFLRVLSDQADPANHRQVGVPRRLAKALEGGTMAGYLR